MNLTIDLSERNATELEAQARSACMPADRLVRVILDTNVLIRANPAASIYRVCALTRAWTVRDRGVGGRWNFPGNSVFT